MFVKSFVEGCRGHYWECWQSLWIFYSVLNWFLLELKHDSARRQVRPAAMAMEADDRSGWYSPECLCLVGRFLFYYRWLQTSFIRSQWGANPCWLPLQFFMEGIWCSVFQIDCYPALTWGIVIFNTSRSHETSRFCHCLPSCRTYLIVLNFFVVILWLARGSAGFREFQDVSVAGKFLDPDVLNLESGLGSQPQL